MWALKYKHPCQQRLNISLMKSTVGQRPAAKRKRKGRKAAKAVAKPSPLEPRVLQRERRLEPWLLGLNHPILCQILLMKHLLRQSESLLKLLRS